MRRLHRNLVLAGLVATFSLTAMAPTFASTAGRKNTALVLTAGTVYSFLKKNNKVAIVGALASAQAWKNYEDSRKRDSRQKNYRYYRTSSHRSYSTYHRTTASRRR